MAYRASVAAGLAALLMSVPALAQDKKAPEGTPLIDEVTACQTQTDAASRLACYDRTVARLRAATERRDLVVLDKQEVRRTRRSLFGFAVPDIPFLNRSDKEGVPEITELKSTITQVRSIGDGRWLMTLVTGSAWQSTEKVRSGEPEAGDPILIKQSLLGGYMANVAGGRAMRVQRVR